MLPIAVAFPFGVVATNRILNTPISRAGTANSFGLRSMLTDMKALANIGGYRALYAGLFVFTLVQIAQKISREENAAKKQIQSNGSTTTETTAQDAFLLEKFGMKRP